MKDISWLTRLNHRIELWFIEAEMSYIIHNGLDYMMDELIELQERKLKIKQLPEYR